MKNILITGASGFIGSFLVEEGLNRGYRVFAGIRETSSRKYLQDDRIQFFIMDLSDKNKLAGEFRRLKEQNIVFDYVIHNAGVTKVVRREDFFRVNFQYTRNLIDALIESKCIPEKFLYIGSQEAFGPGNASTLEPVREISQAKPVSLYGESKLQAEKYIASLNNFPYLVYRPTGVYGPREKDYFTIIKAAKRGFEIYIESTAQHISLLYVKDLARAVLLGLESDLKQKAYFISDGNTYTSEDLVRVIKTLLKKKTVKIVLPGWMVKWASVINGKISALQGKPALLNTDKYKVLTSMNWLCDATEINNDLNFNAVYNLKKGMSETVEWYQNNHWI